MRRNRWLTLFAGLCLCCLMAVGALRLRRPNPDGQGVADATALPKEFVVEEPPAQAAGASVADAQAAAGDEEGELSAETADVRSDTSQGTGQFVMPEGATFENDIVLVALEDGTSLDELNALIAGSDVLADQEVASEDVASGVVALTLADGVTVEGAINALQEQADIDFAQPNYLYEACEEHNETELRELVAAAGSAPEPAGEDASQPSVADAADAAEDMAGLAQDTADADGSPDAEASESGNAADAATQDEPGFKAQDMDVLADATASDATAAEDALTLQEALSVNDPYASGGAQESWALAKIRAFEAWSLARCEGTVSVAVIDNSPYVDHEDLKANVVAYYDAVTKEEAISTPQDHGTEVGGILDAAADNGLGTAGVAYNAGLVAINVMHWSEEDATYYASTKNMVEAYNYLMAYAREHTLRVANVSLAAKASSAAVFDGALCKAITKARDSYGIITVAAAGNSSTDTVPYYSFPGDADDVVSVIGVAGDGKRVSGSNYNTADQHAKNISAPGTSLFSTAFSSPYQKGLTGTSFASPHAAGVLALEFAANPNLTADEAVSVLYASAHDLGADGWDAQTGYGLVDACAAVTMARDPEQVAAAVDAIAKTTAEHEASESLPTPTLTGASRVPVGATATYTVKDGSFKIKSGKKYATLDGSTLTGTKAGTVTLALLDAAGNERATKTVSIYALTGTWTVASALHAKRSYVLDVKSLSLYNKGNVQLWTRTGRANQSWLFELQPDGSFYVRSARAGKVLDVTSYSKKSGANVYQYASTGKSNQRWLMEVDASNLVMLVSKNSGLALATQGSSVAKGTNIVQKTRSSSADQRWELRQDSVQVGPIFDGVYTVKTAVNIAYALDVLGGSKKNGANVQLWKSNGCKAQQWKFEHQGNGCYKVTNVGSGKALDVKDGKKAKGVNVQQWSYGTRKILWQVVVNADGSVTLKRKGTSYVLDVAGGKAKNRANVQQYTGSAKRQRWRLQQY